MYESNLAKEEATSSVPMISIRKILKVVFRKYLLKYNSSSDFRYDADDISDYSSFLSK